MVGEIIEGKKEKTYNDSDNKKNINGIKLKGEDISVEEKKIEYIIFKAPLLDILKMEKRRTLKSLLNAFDNCVMEDKDREKMRDSILDNINDFYRMFIRIVSNLNNNGKDK